MPLCGRPVLEHTKSHPQQLPSNNVHLKLSKSQRKTVLKPVTNAIVPLDNETIGVTFFKISGERVGHFQVVPDTGAQGTVAPASMLGLMGLSKKKLRACQHVYQTVANEKIYVLGEYTFRLQIGSSYVEEDVVFCKNISDIYQSRAGCRGLRLIHPDFPKQLHKNHILPKWVQSVTNSTVPSVNVDLPSKEHIEEVKQAIMSEFADVFSQGDDLKPMIGPPMQIHLKPDARPFALRTCR